MQSTRSQHSSEKQHLWMALLGGLAGLSMWVLFELLTDIVENQRLLLWLASATVGFFVLIFALLGSLRWRDAMMGALLLALVDAALLYWASNRFLVVENLLDESYALLAWGVVLLIGAPFMAAALQGRARDYAALFDISWGIVVRYGAAWVFVGLFWGLLMLSNELLEIVGITIIDDLIDLDPVPYLLTGAALGLALSVAQELSDFISPYLPLRLLRLLLPMVLLVVTVFIVALPIQGLSQLFGDFSAAAILMSVAIAAISLISSALDRVDSDGVQSKMMTFATRGLALLLPILAGLATWAIWVRVSTYGWTPERAAASLAALLILAYGVIYGLAVLQGNGWRRMIRQGNIGMALTVLGLSMLWMTPLMDAQRLSAHSQISRYLGGLTEAEGFPAWEITHSWGLAGQNAVAELQSLDAEGHGALLEKLTRAADLNRWEFNQSEGKPSFAALSQQIEEQLKVWPEDHKVPAEYFSNSSRHQLNGWVDACSREKERPCTLVFGPFGHQGTETSLFFVPEAEGGAEGYGASLENNQEPYFYPLMRHDGYRRLTEDQYQKLIAGGYRIGSASRKSLWFGDVEITSDN
ncbi:DUF4153 domain-containing protein [Cognatishimia activa]|uniref:DUF4153 domain-containing protein n=1 Tax=Cognatishimia activa TaxID=1715691 RepID=A0A0P1IQ39_9RHOB|nr:DUF4153 domain-containing protein [Cognatishimia activa]CUI90201.1 hypothetical protein TA5113_01756 [Cognatishimia activa]CUK25693.1 hypothetical protein TA5114_01495 [Cognatishimia activa]